MNIIKEINEIISTTKDWGKLREIAQKSPDTIHSAIKIKMLEIEMLVVTLTGK